MSIQVIKKKGKPDYLVIPYEEFLEFADEELIDAAYIQEILQDVEGEIINNPVVLARLNAGLTQSELAEKVTPKAMRKIRDCLRD